MSEHGGAEGHIFISYSRKDREIADWVARQLAAAGYEIWIDRRNIPGGADWADELVNAVTEAETLIVFLSPNSIQSQYVLQELETAVHQQVRIIPLVLRPVELPDAFAAILNSLQQIVFWRRRQASIVDLIHSLGGLRGVAAVMPDDSTIAIRESARLIVELLRLAQEVSFGHTSFIFEGGDEWQYYIQFSAVRDKPEIYAEAVGNKNLNENLQLSQERIQKLVELGWQAPVKNSFGNYWRTWQVHTNRDRAAVAATVVNTFLQVYAHLWGEYLQLVQIDLK